MCTFDAREKFFVFDYSNFEERERLRKFYEMMCEKIEE